MAINGHLYAGYAGSVVDVNERNAFLVADRPHPALDMHLLANPLLGARLRANDLDEPGLLLPRRNLRGGEELSRIQSTSRMESKHRAASSSTKSGKVGLMSHEFSIMADIIIHIVRYIGVSVSSRPTIASINSTCVSCHTGRTCPPRAISAPVEEASVTSAVALGATEVCDVIDSLSTLGSLALQYPVTGHDTVAALQRTETEAVGPNKQANAVND